MTETTKPNDPTTAAQTTPAQEPASVDLAEKLQRENQALKERASLLQKQSADQMARLEALEKAEQERAEAAKKAAGQFDELEGDYKAKIAKYEADLAAATAAHERERATLNLENKLLGIGLSDEAGHGLARQGAIASYFAAPEDSRGTVEEFVANVQAQNAHLFDASKRGLGLPAASVGNAAATSGAKTLEERVATGEASTDEMRDHFAALTGL